MHSSPRQDQIDDAIDILNEHAEQCGEVSASLLCVEAMTIPLDMLAAIPLDAYAPPSRRSGYERSKPAFDPLRVIQLSVVMSVEILRRCGRRSMATRPSREESRQLEAIWSLAENRKLSKSGLFEMAGAAAELLSYALKCDYDPHDADLQFGDLAIIVSVACVNTIYGIHHDPEIICDRLIEQIDQTPCDDERRARSNPAIPIYPGAIPNKDLRKLIGEAVRQGFILERLNGSHFRIKHPDLPGMVVFSTSDDPRAIKNTKSQLRKLGVVF